MSIEQLQFIFFPLILLHFVVIPAQGLLRIPAVLGIFVLFLGYFSSMKTRGMLPSSFYGKSVYLVSDGKSADRKFDRSFFNKYNQIAEHYNSHRMKMIFREIGGREDFLKLSGKFSNITYLLSSEANGYFEVAFPKNIFKTEEVAFDNTLKKKAEKYDLDLDNKISIVEVRSLGLKLLLGQAPEILNLPAEPAELSAHYLFWLGKALGKLEPKNVIDQNYYQAEKVALEESVFGFLSEMDGSWRSPEPLAVARMLFGTRMFLQSYQDDTLQQDAMLAASDIIFRSVKSLQREKNTDLVTLARNNFAISRFILANSADDYGNSIRELWKAVQVDPGQKISTGSKIALLNLELIKEAGLD